MKKFNKILISSFLAIIIFYGLFLHFYKIGEQSYWIDEGYTLNAVLSTLEKGYPILDSGQVYGKNYLLNNYLITGVVKLGGFNPIATRSVAAVFGAGVIFLIYLLGKKFFNPLVGLGAAIMTTFSYWEIAWSRQARMYIQLQFFFLLSLYLFNSLLNKFSYKKLVFLISATVATILSHYFGYFLLIIYALILLINLISLKKEQIKEFFNSKTKIITIGLSSLITIVLILKLSLSFFSQLQGRDYFFGLSYQNFLLTNIGIVTITALIGVVIAIVKEKNLKPTIILLTSYLIPYLIIIFSVNSLHFRYLFFILPILFLFSAYFINYLANFSKYKHSLYLILLIILIVSSNLLNPNTFVFKAQSHYYLEPHTPQPDFKSAYRTIIKQGWDDDKVIVSAFTQLDKVYLGRSDYWLAIDLYGHSLDKNKLSEREYYNNAITIKDVEQLKELIESKSGYIIVDNMTGIRLDREINDLINQQKLIFYNKTGQQDPIWVFAF